MQQTPETPPIGYTLGMFPAWLAPAIRMHKGKVHCVWGCPINDFGIVPQPTPAEAYNNGTLALVAKVREVDPAATITICTSTATNIPAMQAWRLQVDTLIRNGAAANGYGMVDLAADPFLANPANTKDGTHLTNAGFDRMAELIGPRIAAWEAALP